MFALSDIRGAGLEKQIDVVCESEIRRICQLRLVGIRSPETRAATTAASGMTVPVQGIQSCASHIYTYIRVM